METNGSRVPSIVLVRPFLDGGEDPEETDKGLLHGCDVIMLHQLEEDRYFGVVDGELVLKTIRKSTESSVDTSAFWYIHHLADGTLTNFQDGASINKQELIQISHYKTGQYLMVCDQDEGNDVELTEEYDNPATALRIDTFSNASVKAHKTNVYDGSSAIIG
jgi:hypothetical protein